MMTFETMLHFKKHESVFKGYHVNLTDQTELGHCVTLDPSRLLSWMYGGVSPTGIINYHK